jgi:hypothetical protein
MKVPARQLRQVTLDIPFKLDFIHARWLPSEKDVERAKSHGLFPEALQNLQILGIFKPGEHVPVLVERNDHGRGFPTGHDNFGRERIRFGLYFTFHGNLQDADDITAMRKTRSPSGLLRVMPEVDYK